MIISHVDFNLLMSDLDTRFDNLRSLLDSKRKLSSEEQRKFKISGACNHYEIPEKELQLAKADLINFLNIYLGK